MIYRIISPSISKSFFLFGARGTGKTTFLREQFEATTRASTWFIDLMDPEQEDLYSRRPKMLELELIERKSRGEKIDWVVIDEIQRVPALLNVVHRLIESHKQRFVLTGSSARKLKRGAANLLAGRAHVSHLFPFTSIELKDQFKLDETLEWGTLPEVIGLINTSDRRRTLRAYALTYLKEEIQAEQLIRNLTPFRNFLEVAAQLNGKAVNFLRTGQALGVDHKTIQSYYSILEETWIGYLLPAFSLSVRKQQKMHPKFYFFDGGVKRALDGTLDSKLVPRTAAYGEAFEAWIINEILRFNSYFEQDYSLSYLETSGGGEIDLLLKKGRSVIAIEIKATNQKDEREISKLETLAKDIPGIEAIYYLSQDPRPEKMGKVHCLFWREGLGFIFKQSQR